MSVRVGVNLLWLRSGQVGGSQEYLLRQLTGLHEINNNEFDVTLFVQPGFAQNHEDLAKIYKFGVAMNFSDAQGTIMLQLLQDMFDRHPGTNIQLRSTWASLKRAIQKQKTEKAFEITNYTLPLPAEYFGATHHVTNRPLKPYRTTGVNVFCIIADRLLNLSHSDNLITKWREDEGIPREHQILGDKQMV